MNNVVVTCKSCGKKVRVYYTTGDPDYYVPIECHAAKKHWSYLWTALTTTQIVKDNRAADAQADGVSDSLVGCAKA